MLFTWITTIQLWAIKGGGAHIRLILTKHDYFLFSFTKYVNFKLNSYFNNIFISFIKFFINSIIKAITKFIIKNLLKHFIKF